MGLVEMDRIADMVDRALTATTDGERQKVKADVRALADAFPLYGA